MPKTKLRPRHFDKAYLVYEVMRETPELATISDLGVAMRAARGLATHFGYGQDNGHGAVSAEIYGAIVAHFCLRSTERVHIERGS